MTVMGFEPHANVINGRRVRASRFEKRSLLPVSAACVVANGVRQTLGELLGATVAVRLLEPVLPAREAWSQICAGAIVFAISGESSDAALVLRAEDALALAGAALGERIEGFRRLSPIENELIVRMARALSGTLAAVCGAPRTAAPSTLRELTGFTTYFELIVEEPVGARIGVALSREPRPAVHPGIVPDSLNALEVELLVEAAHAYMSAAEIANVRAGQVVMFDSVLGDAAIVRAGETIVGRGECGEMAMRRVVFLR